MKNAAVVAAAADAGADDGFDGGPTPDGWHPVAAERDLVARGPLAARIAGLPLALWRDADGRAHAVLDRCPHRGTRLSLGAVVERDGQSRLECPYHGWQFAADGRCRHVPALPGFDPPPTQRVDVHDVRSAHGLLWAKAQGDDRVAGDAAAAFAVPELGALPARAVVCGPYDVRASAPRVVENFLDMSHFAFVHEGVLGDRGEAAVPGYDVVVDARGAPSVEAYLAYQPQAALGSAGGAWMHYRYRVLTPFSAVLHKGRSDGAATQDAVGRNASSDDASAQDAVALWTCPLSHESTRVWMTVFTGDLQSETQALVAFQDRIFSQDLPILESQRPKRLPLAGRELHSAADRLSAAYRRYLVASGVAIGVTRG